MAAAAQALQKPSGTAPAEISAPAAMPIARAVELPLQPCTQWLQGAAPAGRVMPQRPARSPLARFEQERLLCGYRLPAAAGASAVRASARRSASACAPAGMRSAWPAALPGSHKQLPAPHRYIDRRCGAMRGCRMLWPQWRRAPALQQRLPYRGLVRQGSSDR